MTIRTTGNLATIQLRHSLNNLLNRSKNDLSKNHPAVDINSPEGMAIATKMRENLMNRSPFDGRSFDVVELSSNVNVTESTSDTEKTFENCSKNQYQVFSDLLQKSGFYDGMSDEQVKKYEDLLHEITSDIDDVCMYTSSITDFDKLTERGFFVRDESGTYTYIAGSIKSHAAMQISFESSILALKTFADKYVTDDKIKADFNSLIDECYDFNKETVENWHSLDDWLIGYQKRKNTLLEELLAKNPKILESRIQDPTSEQQAKDVLGKVTHTKEETDTYNATIKALLSQLTDKSLSKESVINDIQKTMFDYLSGGSKDSNVLDYLSKMSSNLFGEMLSYWNKLT